MPSKLKLLLFLALLAVYRVGSASDEWLYLGSAKNNKFDYYIRPKLIKSEIHLRNTWVLFDYQDGEKEVKSAVALNEYDCNLRKVRTNYLIQFNEGMATGDVLMSSGPSGDDDKWRPVEVGTVTEVVMKEVCSYDGKTPIFRS